MERVPFLDMTSVHQEIRADLDQAVSNVVDSAQFLYGPPVQQFEEEFAEFVGAKHAVSVGSGLAALTLTLRAWGIGPGDEVIVPANTFIATFLAVSAVGAVVVPVDPDPSTYNLDASTLRKAIGPRTRVVIPVHLYGQPCDLESIGAVARAHGLKILQDAAQAHGARYRQNPLGVYGDAAAFSFYPAKNLGAFGDAGAVVTNDGDLATILRKLRNYGSEVKYVYQIQGENSRMSTLNAAVLRVKLRRLESWNHRRGEIALHYQQGLRGVDLPIWPPQSEPSWHLYVVQSPHRNQLLQYLQDLGIEAMVHYPIPPHRQAAYQNLAMPWGSLPVTEQLSRQVLSLPMGPHLSDEQVERVIETVNVGVRRLGVKAMRGGWQNGRNRRQTI